MNEDIKKMIGIIAGVAIMVGGVVMNSVVGWFVVIVGLWLVASWIVANGKENSRR